MSNMFQNCEKLEELNILNFNTKNVINTSYMFCNCSSLNILRITNLFLSKNCRTKYMFSSCNENLIKKIKNKSINIKDYTFENERKENLKMSKIIINPDEYDEFADFEVSYV